MSINETLEIAVTRVILQPLTVWIYKDLHSPCFEINSVLSLSQTQLLKPHQISPNVRGFFSHSELKSYFICIILQL